MGDWTTKVISDHAEIDLHYDLDSFPVTLRADDVYGNLQTIAFSRQEAYKLMLILLELYSTG